MNQRVAPVSRQNEIVEQELKGELLIYDLKTNKAFCLNETSALVRRLSDGTKSIAEISETMSGKFKLPVTEGLVWLALEQLKRENLLSNAEEIASNFNGLSRREVIKKVGLASMIALPVVSSLVAPPAAAAQSSGSCIAAGEACFSGDVCCPGLTCAAGLCDTGNTCASVGEFCDDFTVCCGTAFCNAGNACE